MKKTRCSGGIIFNNGKYLLVKHKEGGHWDFPKGHAEEGETEEETALREIYEETGLR
ncbi:NUDIX domain-containing protein, partial [Candidatus Woesearchaeota archaeon]|nr:NUDIX domain-containing protein [Candidatus Woesearchaeota archaeon]